MRIFITGGAGFAGSHLAEQLLDLCRQVDILAAEKEDLVNTSQIRNRVRVERADLRDASRLEAIVRDVAPQHVYHLAALSSPSDSVPNPSLTYEVNLMGTLNLLLACRALTTECRFLFVSSSEVYGRVREENLPLREDTPLCPGNPFAGTKAAGELLAYQFFRSYGLPVVRVRPFNHTGPRQSSEFLCSDFARQIAEIDAGLRPPTLSVGNLKVSRDLSDVRDNVCGYRLLLDKGEPGEVYQLGSGRAVTIEEVVQILVGMGSKSIRVVVDPSRVRPAEAPAL